MKRMLPETRKSGLPSGRKREARAMTAAASEDPTIDQSESLTRKCFQVKMRMPTANMKEAIVTANAAPTSSKRGMRERFRAIMTESPAKASHIDRKSVV